MLSYNTVTRNSVDLLRFQVLTSELRALEVAHKYTAKSPGQTHMVIVPTTIDSSRLAKRIRFFLLSPFARTGY